MKDYKYSLDIMKRELESKFICPEIRYAFLASIEALEESVRNKWISIEDRLPTIEEYQENDGRFIVSDGNRVYQSLFDVYEKMSFLDILYKGNCDLEELVDERVIAWMSLPKYK